MKCINLVTFITVSYYPSAPHSTTWLNLQGSGGLPRSSHE